ncbi:hypothetical protein BH09ACT12_BH09ACT12_30150 [soil metagenome]
MRHLRSAVPVLATVIAVAVGGSAFAFDDAGSATSASTQAASGPVAELLAGSYEAEFGRLSVAGKAQIKSKRAPSVSGRPKLGRPLTVTAGTWKPAKVRLTYAWYAGSKKIKGAKGATYKPAADVVGDDVSVRVTAIKKGYRSATVKKQAGTIKPGTITSTKKPKIRGDATLNQKLKVSDGSWSVGGVNLSYTWSRGSKVLSDDATYRVTRSDLNQRITVLVTANKPGYRPTSVRRVTDAVQR